MRDVGVGKRDVPVLAQDAMLQGRLLQNNPREITQNDAQKLYEAAL
ncbi:MAG: hypothetical protein KBI08_12900 [Sphingobium sp.]|nr:hypothetical protein [Sphingobium sp.]MBP9159019.1 hypothetical protein [Sphingobium sp.]